MNDSIRNEAHLLIAFADLTRYSAQSLCVTDAQLADTMSAYYALVEEHVAARGGRVVKFIGDAALVVFPEEIADRGVDALLSLKSAADAFFEARGWPCRLIVKAHFGAVIAGDFAGRYDVLGKEVNAAAMLDSLGVALSVEAFRKLSPELRQRFKKHTPTITYIRIEDPHRFRRSRD
jgi:class 3 adenylate cyclase